MRKTDGVERASSSEVDKQRKLLKRVVSSATFGRAERLSTLLLYLCEQSFRGNGMLLTEQHLGEEVFGRTRGYDCSLDRVVRTHASRLRQRLTAYFDGEGLAEPTRIILPPSKYVPIFEAHPGTQTKVNSRLLIRHSHKINTLRAMAISTLPEKVSGTRNQGLLADPRWQLVERVISSPHLCKSGRLCAFLQFVCEESLLGRGDQLNEQRIGVQVFERRVDYDSAEDNIVRSHASRLRQRLEAYFLVEGQNEALRLTLPRGAYIPQFESSVPPQEESSSAVAAGDARLTEPTAPVSAVATTSSRSVVILAVALVAMTVVALWQWNAYRLLARSTRTASPVMRVLWDQLFVPGRQTLIVPGDSTLVLYENLTGEAVSLRSYMDKGYLAADTVSPLQSSEQIARRIAHRRLTSIADAQLISNLLRLPEAVESPPVIRFARDMQVSDLKGSNGVLIGAKEANPWLSMFEARRNFTIDDDQQARVFTVSNRSPRSGELPVYYAKPDDPKHLAYALVSLVPNLDSSGFLLIVEGTSIAGTEAAADFLTHTPSQIESILAPALKQYGRIPPFEVLLETTNVNGSATQSRVVAFRVSP